MPYNWTKTADEIKSGAANGKYQFNPKQLSVFYHKIEGKKHLKNVKTGVRNG